MLALIQSDKGAPVDERTPKEVLPDLTPIGDLEVRDASDVLSDDERTDLLGQLDELARTRRRAESTSSQLRLS
jgi:hypothetical protein